MGENKHINELDAFAKKHIKSIEKEKPSMDFTASVMQTILKAQSVTKFTYEPLISKKVWFLILTAVISLFFIPLERSNRSQELWDKVDLSVDFSLFETAQFSGFLDSLNFSLSSSSTYAMLLCAMMLGVQVVVLKNYFSNKTRY